MKGQWIGKVEGDIEGQIIVNIDDLGKKYGGVAFVLPAKKDLPSSAAFFETLDKKRNATFRAFTAPINPQTGLTCAWGDIQHLYPGVNHATEANAKLRFKKNELQLTATTNLQTNVKIKLTRKPFTASSEGVDGVGRRHDARIYE